MKRKGLAAAVAFAVSLVAGVPLTASAEPDLDATAMAKALPLANVSLEQGLNASQREGIPISAKYEIENGALQLSVYTMNPDRYSEVIVDYRSGAIAKSAVIAEGADLEVAGVQNSAMAAAKITLAVAVGDAVKANVGYRAIAVAPELRDGHAVAVVVLLKGQDVRKVTQKLE